MLNIVKPKEFIIQVKKCGNDSCSAGYSGVMKDSNPVHLSLSVCNLMGKQFAGEHSPNYMYWLGCSLLAGLEGIDKKQMLKDIDNAFEVIKDFDLSKQISGSEK